MTDQAQRLEIATVRAEIGSNITYRFNNDAIDAPLIQTDSGNIKNLKQVIADIQQQGAEKISFATRIYPTTAAGIAATADQEIFLVASSDADEIYAVWKNTAGVAVDTGKRAISASAVIAATDAAQASANDAQTAASEATAKVAPFLSPASTDPTVRVDGSALQPGDTYFNTIIQAIKVYSTSGWVAANVTGTDLSAAINTREPSISPGSSGQFYSADKTFKAVTKENVGLVNVDNTSDSDKPVSTAQQDALDLKASVGDVSIQVSNLTALKAVNVSLIKYVTRLGYSQPGDGGLSFWLYDSSSTATPDNFMVVAPNNGPGRWLLNHNGIVSVKLAGAKGDGVSDDYAAIVRAHTGFPCIYYPSATYACSQNVELTGAHGAVGDGLNKSFILFNGATKGMGVVQTLANQGFRFDGITFLTNTASTSTVGLKIDGTLQMSTINDGFRYILGSRNIGRGTIGKIGFSGVDNNSGWGVGLNMLSEMNYSIQEVVYTGAVPEVVGDLTGVAVLLNGDGAPTDVRICKVWAFYAKYGILMPDYMEGIHINDFEMVPVTFGIIGRYVAGYSVLPEASTGCLGVFLGDGHINCLQAGVDLRKTNAAKIGKLDVALQPRDADAPATCVYIQGGNDNIIRDLTMSGDAAQNTKMQNRGLVLDGCGLSTVDTASSTSLESCVKLVGTSYSKFSNLSARAGINVINGDSGSLYNRIKDYSALSNSGPAVQVALDNSVVLFDHSTIRTVTFSGGPGMTISIPLPIGTFSEAPITGQLVFHAGSIFFEYQYNRAASSATSAVFYLAPASPATTLPESGTVEFSATLRGK